MRGRGASRGALGNTLDVEGSAILDGKCGETWDLLVNLIPPVAVLVMEIEQQSILFFDPGALLDVGVQVASLINFRSTPRWATLGRGLRCARRWRPVSIAQNCPTAAGIRPHSTGRFCRPSPCRSRASKSFFVRFGTWRVGYLSGMDMTLSSSVPPSAKYNILYRVELAFGVKCIPTVVIGIQVASVSKQL